MFIQESSFQQISRYFVMQLHFKDAEAHMPCWRPPDPRSTRLHCLLPNPEWVSLTPLRQIFKLHSSPEIKQAIPTGTFCRLWPRGDHPSLKVFDCCCRKLNKFSAEELSSAFPKGWLWSDPITPSTDRACRKHHDHTGSMNLLTSCPCCIPCFYLVTLARQAFNFPFWLRRASEASHVLNQDVIVDEALIWVFLISPLSIPSGKEQPVERSTVLSPVHPSGHSESNNEEDPQF